VGFAPEFQVGLRGRAADSVRHDVVELDEAPLVAPPAILAHEGAVAEVPDPHGAHYAGGNVAGSLGRPAARARLGGCRELVAGQVFEQCRQCAVDDGGCVSARDGVAQQVLRELQLLPRSALAVKVIWYRSGASGITTGRCPESGGGIGTRVDRTGTPGDGGAEAGDSTAAAVSVARATAAPVNVSARGGSGVALGAGSLRIETATSGCGKRRASSSCSSRLLLPDAAVNSSS
jgi:hypothetical protein